MTRNIFIYEKSADGYRIAVQQYNQQDVDRIKSIPADCRVYDADTKIWTVTSPAALALFAIENIDAVSMSNRMVMADDCLKAALLGIVKSGDLTQDQVSKAFVS